MIARCNNKNLRSYSNYGGRGIKVCQQWRESFDDFLKDMGKRPSGRSLDRINNDGNYEPSNCRWATPEQQRRNSRQSLTFLTAHGKTQCVQDWALELGLSPTTIYSRMSRKFSDEQVLSTAPLSRRDLGGCRSYTYKGRRMNVTQWANQMGMTATGLQYRLDNWSLDRALGRAQSKKGKRK